MSENPSIYAQAGVDTDAGDIAVEMMKAAVSKTQGPEVFGGFGGFAGLFDVSALKSFTRPLLATSTDGVGTKVAIAQAIDKHDTIGQDLVGMVVDDIIVVGAVEADALLGPERVRNGDVIVAMAASGFHSNGYSLVRHILARADVLYTDHSNELGASYGEALLEPTRLYTTPLLGVLEDPELAGSVHALSHVTGGGISANLARVLPTGSWCEVDRATWSPLPVFRHLAELGGHELGGTEGAWNMGVGMIAVVDAGSASSVIAKLQASGISSWVAGRVSTQARDLTGFEQGAKGVNGGAVRLVGDYATA